MANIHIYDVPDNRVCSALQCAISFAKEFPNRVGVGHGCGYTLNSGGCKLYVYRTKSGRIVVRGNEVNESALGMT
jgi:hypothetical protein